MTPVWVHHTNEADYAAVCQYVSQRIWDQARNFGQGTAMVVIEDGRAVAAVIFHNFDREAGVIEFSGASDNKRWLTRPVIREIFGYIFNDLGCQATVARVDEDNKPLARILKAYGFESYIIPRLRGREKSEAVFVLTDDAWRSNGFHKEHEYG